MASLLNLTLQEVGTLERDLPSRRAISRLDETRLYSRVSRPEGSMGFPSGIKRDSLISLWTETKDITFGSSLSVSSFLLKIYFPIKIISTNSCGETETGTMQRYKYFLFIQIKINVQFKKYIFLWQLFLITIKRCLNFYYNYNSWIFIIFLL